MNGPLRVADPRLGAGPLRGIRAFGRSAARSGSATLAVLALLGMTSAPAQFAVSGRIVGSSSGVSSGGGFSVGGAARVPEVTVSAAGEFSLRGVVIPRTTSASDFDPQPDPPKPDHWWSADGGVRDLVGRGVGTEVGGLTYAPGLVGTAFQFNGKDAAIRFGPGIGNFGTNDFGIEFLVRSVTRARAPFLLKRAACEWGNMLEVSDSAATLVEDRFQRNWVDIPYGRSLNDGDWHHLALTRRGTSVAFYIDGTPVFSQAFKFVTAISNAVDLVAGVSPCAPHTGVSPLSGMMDEIKIYEGRAPTPAQIAAAARVVKTLTLTEQPRGATFARPAGSHTLRVSAVSTAPAPPYGTLGYQWYFDQAPIPGATRETYTISPVDAHTAGRYRVAVNDGVGTVFGDGVDVEVQSFDLPRPAHWWPLDGDLADAITGEEGRAVNGRDFVVGRVGSAFQFRGPNYLDLGGTAGNLGTSDFTVTLWMLASNTVVSPTLLSWKTNCGAGTWWRAGLIAPDLGISQPELSFSGGNYTQIDAYPAGQSATNNVKDGRWHHLAFVRQGTNALVYRDGVRVATGRAEVLAALTAQGRLLAGVDPCNIRTSTTSEPVNHANPFFGRLDEIRIYPVALVRPEIVAEMRRAPATLANPNLPPQLVVDGVDGPTRFKWLIEPAPGQTLTSADADGVDLEASPDLRIWTVIPGAVRLVGGRVEIADIEAFSKRESFYRIIRRDPAANNALGGEVPTVQVAAEVLAAAQRHVSSFIGSSDPGDPDAVLWAGVVFGPTARYLFDPAYRNGSVPAFVELKLVSRATNEDRGYVMMSVAEEQPLVVEFAVEGATKTDRALAEIPGRRPKKFMRFNPAFIAMEDADGALLGTWGTLPLMAAGDGVPTERARYTGEYLGETGVVTPLEAVAHKPFRLANSYAELRSATALDATRTVARLARSSSAGARFAALGPGRVTLRLRVGETFDAATDRAFSKVRVDVDDEVPAVEVRPLERGFRIVGTRPGTEIIRAQDGTGAIATFGVRVTAAAGLASAGLHGGCDDQVVHYWGAGTGWNGDQRQYRQVRSQDWCPVVGCGPTALLMLFGWWDAHGVPSAFYSLREGIGQPDDDFRFAYHGLASADAPKRIPRGEITTANGIPMYEPTAEEILMAPVAADLFELCNTFCVSGQGATQPGDLIHAARTYVDRVVRNLPVPQNEFGEKLVGAEIRHDYTDWYWAGGTDWEGGGLLVANGIKAGRPGIVGLGDTLFDLHYALAYAYKRVDTFEGCGSDRELVDRRRWFKCNMGWGSKHDPEYHDAESVWFGLTMNLWQKQPPHSN